MSQPAPHGRNRFRPARKAWRWFRNLNLPLQLIAAALTILVLASPAATITLGLFDRKSSTGTRIVSPKDGDTVPRGVEVEFFLTDADLRDQETDIAFALCTGPRCYLVDRLVPTGGGNVYKRVELGPAQLQPGQGRYVLRLDRLSRNTLDGLLQEKQKEIDATANRDWKGFEPERLGSEPLHSITVRRATAP